MLTLKDTVEGRKCNCGNNPGVSGRLLTDEEKVQFLALVDSNATMKQLTRTFQITKENVDYHIFFSSYYRLYLERKAELLEIFRKLDGASDEICTTLNLRKDAIQIELKEVWRVKTDELQRLRSSGGQ